MTDAWTPRLRPAQAPARGVLRRLGRDERGGVAMILGLSAVPLLLAVGAGIELTNWMLVRTQLQRTADLAALAGAKEYMLAGDARAATNAAANLAEMNGVQGGTSRAWDEPNLLLTDNKAVAQITTGVGNTDIKAVKVTVSQPISLVLTSMLSSTQSITITATGWANVGFDTQPCLLALDTGGPGVDAQGSVSVDLTGCAVRSNAFIQTGGSAYLSASAFYARGSITGDERPVDRRYPNRSPVADPYAADARVQSAINTAKSASGSKYNGGSPPPRPNSLSSDWDIKSNVSLASGIYYVNGNISLGAQAVLSGSGVTIVTTGTITMQGGSTVQLTAAQVGQSVDGAIPGIVFIGSSSGNSTFRGNTGSYLTGVIYNPNGVMDFGGTARNGGEGCLQVIAKGVTLNGNSGMASKCGLYGVRPVTSDAQAAVLAQ